VSASGAAGADVSLSMYVVPDLSLLSSKDVEILLNAYTHASRAVFISWVPFIGACLLSTVVIRDRGLAGPNTIQPTTEADVT
jgi:hypothetical protein